MPASEIMSLKDMMASITWEQFLIEASSKKIYIDVLRNYPVFCSFVFFWVGCNIGSFLNVCIYRLPLGMSLFHPKSHCPKCGHKLSFYENIPIFSWLFLCGRCKECGESISSRYIIVETLTGLLFTGLYLKVQILHLPLHSLVLLFFVTAIVLAAAFTDCDLRVIPNALTYPALLLIPLYHLFHLWPSLRIYDWQSFLYSVLCMAGAAAVLSSFSLLGRWVFHREAFGWGDVKYLTAVAGAFGWLPLLLILTCASVVATVYMPIYWLFRPKRKHRGFAFAPFLSIFTIAWCLSGEWILRGIVFFFRND